MDVHFGRGLRALRIRASLRQVDVGNKAHVSRAFVAKAESGAIDGTTVGNLRRLAAVFGATVDVRLRWKGEGLDRLLDEAHSRLVDSIVVILRATGWEVAVEVSFSIWGERGSIDVLAFYRLTGTVLVIEVKSVVPDSQATLHGLDRKARLAPQIAAERGWQCRTVARLLVVGDSTTSRRRVARFGAMYDAGLPDRGTTVRRWLRRPAGPLAGVLFLPYASRGGAGRDLAGRERVRRANPAQTPLRKAIGEAEGPRRA